ncbi:CarD family transcriptional regulator [Ornithinibacter aureus]|nr:CarD family transcriptional regulator [Ornithinibacter aureus]
MSGCAASNDRPCRVHAVSTTGAWGERYAWKALFCQDPIHALWSGLPAPDLRKWVVLPFRWPDSAWYPECRERGQQHMVFKVGETVVYPHHGAARIEEIKTRTIRGEEKLYLKLKVAQGDLVIEVPAENCDLVGVRDVVSKEGLDKVFEVLRTPFAEEPTNWSRRFKANLEKLASGDVIKVAEVVRDLWRRDKDRGLSAGEKRMLAKARQILVSELALAEKTDEEKAEVILDEVLAS